MVVGDAIRLSVRVAGGCWVCGFVQVTHGSLDLLVQGLEGGG